MSFFSRLKYGSLATSISMYKSPIQAQVVDTVVKDIECEKVSTLVWVGRVKYGSLATSISMYKSHTDRVQRYRHSGQRYRV